MILEGLHQPPVNTTLMGVLIGALRYHGSQVSDAWAYGASGHAFVMNIHAELCPSGPYCWNQAGLFAAARNLGVATTDLGFFHSGSSPAERAQVEGALQAALDAGVPCGLVNMEFQLITGYDETGFLTAQPWPGHDFPPAHLMFGTWAEMGDETHVNFFKMERVAPSDERVAVVASLRYAVDLYRNPTRHSDEPYAVGAGAWAMFIGAVRAGHGSSHGNWWNATVWGECREMAADYFVEIAGKYPQAQRAASALATDYRVIADALTQVSNRELDRQVKIGLLEQAAAREADCVARLEALAADLGVA